MMEESSPAKKPKLQHQICINCQVNFRKISAKNKKIIIINEERDIYGKHLKKPVSIGDVLCSKCRIRISFKGFEVTKAYDRVDTCLLYTSRCV